MQNTPNYGLKKPGQEDFYNVDDFNANADIIDTEVSNLENNKLDKTGDASNVTNTFTQASTRANLVSGEKQTTTFGKLMKWFADLKPVAWSGNASDLTEDASNRLVTDTEKTSWNGKLDKSGGTMTGDIVLRGEPTQNLHPVTKQYTDLGLRVARTLINEIDIGYDDTIYATTPIEEILEDLFIKSQNLVGTDKPFELTFNTSDYENLNLYNKVLGFVYEAYGGMIPYGESLGFKMEVATIGGQTLSSGPAVNKCSVWNKDYYFEWEFDYDNWSNVIVRDRKGIVHADLAFDIKSYMQEEHGFNLDVPYINYIDGITFYISDYDSEISLANMGDSQVRYVKRSKPVSKPESMSHGLGDTLFDAFHSFVGSSASPNNPIGGINNITQMYFSINGAVPTDPFPNGIRLEGGLTTVNTDQVLSYIIIHFGNKDWSNTSNQLQFRGVANVAPSEFRVGHLDEAEKPIQQLNITEH